MASAHRAPKFLESVIESSIESGCRIFIGMAGMAAALPGVIASMTTLPVIGVPVGGKVPLDSLLSIVQMPPGMPVATVGVDRGDNAGALAVQMLALTNTDLARQYDAWRVMKTAKVISDDESLIISNLAHFLPEGYRRGVVEHLAGLFFFFFCGDA